MREGKVAAGLTFNICLISFCLPVPYCAAEWEMWAFYE